MTTLEQFRDKFAHKSAIIGIVGLGYVGIPLAMRFSEVGFSILGFDIDQTRIDNLNAGINPIKSLSDAGIKEMKTNGFEATSDFSRISEADTIIICVPTPLDAHREPDMSYIVSTMKQVAPHLRSGQMLSLESTTYPGTTREIILPFIEEAKLKAGEDIFLVYSPEREDPGNKEFNTNTIPKVVGGLTSNCLQAGEIVYGQAIEQVVPVDSVEVAELTKLLENIHRAVNIGLVNEMKIIADRMGINIFDVIDAAATKPFGFTPYYPGPGLGGHCIPIDPFYLTWKAREYNVNTRFIELAGEINREMPVWVTTKIGEALNDHEKPIKGSKILAIGIAYKADVDDMRESPAVFVMEQLRDRGALIDYHDPWVPSFPKMRQHDFNLDSVELTPENIAKYDCVLVLTAHSNVDYEIIKANSKLIVDTRNVYKKDADHIVRA